MGNKNIRKKRGIFLGHYDKHQLTIMTTTQCNMHCVYCLTNARERGNVYTINEAFARAVIRDYLSSCERPWIRFYGAGEATIEFDMIKRLINYADNMSSVPVYYELQTNGYFSLDVAEYIAHKFNIVYVSIDGAPDINDKQRLSNNGKSISESIIRNIKLLNRTTTVGVRATITVLNVNKQREMVDFFSSIGIKYMFSKPVLPSVNSNENLEYAVPLMTYAENYLDAYKYAKDKGIFYGNIYIVNFDGETDVFCRACHPYPHATPDNYVSCCDRAFLGNIGFDELIYGYFDAGSDAIVYDYDKIRKICNRKTQNMPKCVNCPVKKFCGGACLGTAHQRNGDYYVPYDEECEVIKYLYKHIGNEVSLALFHP